MSLSDRKVFGIYIHIPFCVKKCNYCDFNSFPAGDEKYYAYVDALCREIEADCLVPEGYQVDTVFIGGGTPSVVPSFLIEKILCKLKSKYYFTDFPEISIEVNPGTVTLEKLSDYRRFGINRLSIGMQSLNDDELKTLGRIHNRQDCEDTISMARAVGFDNINLDLMNQIPGQTADSFKNTLTKAIDFKLEHISCYSLIVEEGTPFGSLYEKGELKLPSEEISEEIDRITDELLETAGYDRYEVSNFSKKGYECRHNMSYWRRTPYRGFGLSAASLLEFDNGDCRRFTGEADFEKYISYADKKISDRIFAQENIRLSADDRMEEFIFLGLRTVQGISVDLFAEFFGKNIFSEYEKPLKKYMDMGLVTEQVEDGKKWLKLSKKGMLISNPILADFLK